MSDYRYKQLFYDICDYREIHDSYGGKNYDLVLYPWADGRQMLMLFNENVVNLDKFMNMTEKQSFKDIIA